MKTIKQWLESIAIKDIRDAALNNATPKSLERQTETLADAIEDGFVWNGTIEGYKYWNTIFNQALDGEL